MVALYEVVKGLQLSNPELRMRPEMLTTGAITAYMINALIYRPGEGRAEEVLLQVSCKHFLLENGPRASMYDRGAYFLSDIRKKPDEHAYCLPSARALENHHIIRLYRRPSMNDVAEEFRPVKSPKKGKMVRQARNRKLTSLMSSGSSYLTDDESSDESSESSEWDSDEECDSSQSTERDTTGNVGSNDSIAPKNSGRQVAEIVDQFPSCVMQLVPDPSTATETPWVLISPATRKRVDCNLFKTYQILDVFPHVQFKVVNEHGWYYIFDRYFPEKDSSPKKRQHFTRAQYLIQWTNLMDASDHEAAKDLRQTVFKWFKELYWVPHPESDRMWSRKPGTACGWDVLPAQSPKTGARLAFNAHYWKDRPSPNANLLNTASNNESGQVKPIKTRNNTMLTTN